VHCAKAQPVGAMCLQGVFKGAQSNWEMDSGGMVKWRVMVKNLGSMMMENGLEMVHQMPSLPCTLSLVSLCFHSRIDIKELFLVPSLQGL
jgi:hypothetical protein